VQLKLSIWLLLEVEVAAEQILVTMALVVVVQAASALPQVFL
jgi:hypothetical protein